MAERKPDCKGARRNAIVSTNYPNRELTNKYRELITNAARLGWSQKQIADLLGVSGACISNWLKSYPDFGEMVRTAKHEADMQAETALARLLKGCTTKEKRTGVDASGNVIDIEIDKEHKPDIQAIKYYLNNRSPSKWRDSSSIDHTSDGKPIDNKIIVKIIDNKKD